MGLWKDFRTARAINAAVLLVENRLQVEAALGRLRKEDAKRLAEGLVVALCQKMSVLVSGRACPTPVLMAAAALANGVQDTDSLGRRQLGDTLFSALKSVWALDIPQLVDVERVAGVDAQLMELAGAVFEIGSSSDAKALRRISEEAMGLTGSTAEGRNDER